MGEKIKTIRETSLVEMEIRSTPTLSILYARMIIHPRCREIHELNEVRDMTLLQATVF